MTEHNMTVVIPGDDPPQIGRTPALERLRERTEAVLYENRPVSHMFGLMLAVAKNTADQIIVLKNGRWTAVANVMLQGKRLGIIGTSATGAHLARFADQFGMEVVAWSYPPGEARAKAIGVRYVPVHELLTTSAVISLHVRLSEQSRGLIGAAEIAEMRPGAIRLNGARGPAIDTPALVDALHRGHLHGVGIEVFDEELLPPNAAIAACPRVVLTPQRAEQTPEAVSATNEGAVENLFAFLDGKPCCNAAN